MKKLDLKVGFSCNNRCLFCVQGRKREYFRDKSTQQIKKEMKEGKKECEEIVLTGGEPTIRPDFLKLVSYAKKLGFKKIQIQSNGRMFAYLDFCKKTIEAGANEFCLALHGHLPELHDFLTRSPGSFYQTVQGIRNLKLLKQKVLVNVVVTKPNYRHLPEIANLLVSLGVDQYQFAFVHPLGSAKENFEMIVPRMSLIEPYIKQGLEIGIKAGKIVMTEAIPYCLMEGYEDYIAEKIIPPTKIYDANFVIEDYTIARKKEGKAKGANCLKCLYYKICEGPWREYPEVFGWTEFKPVDNRSLVSQNSQIMKCIDEIFNFLIKENELLKYKSILNQIKDILFFNFNSSWLSENQKFDFSFSGEKKALRFSYNNYKEKEKFSQKIIKIFELFENFYNKDLLIQILNLMNTSNDKHQTTIGIEWINNQNYPRIKLYFEELFHYYTNEERIKKLQEICKLVDFDYESLKIQQDDEIGAFCVDFLPENEINLKVYFLLKELNEEKIIKLISELKVSSFKRESQKFLTSLSKSKCFYYLTKRFNPRGELLSLKFYKIYETKQFKDLTEPMYEILNFLKKLKYNFTIETIKKLLNIAKKFNLVIYPVIIAIDFSRKGVKIDSYFSLKK
jgi:MoaA/NifB/PqqE/SkfB family radical SAM enzyme